MDDLWRRAYHRASLRRWSTDRMKFIPPKEMQMEAEKTGDERYPLDDSAIAMLAELHTNMRSAQVAVQAILTYFARMHKIEGQIQLADNGRELILRRTPQ